MKKIQNLKGINSLESICNNETIKEIVNNNESGLYTISLNNNEDVSVYISKDGRVDINYNYLDNLYFDKNGFENYIRNISNIETLKEIPNPIKLYNSETIRELIDTMEDGVYSGVSSNNEDIIVHISKNNRMDVYIYEHNGHIVDNGYNAYGNQDYTQIIAKYRKIS